MAAGLEASSNHPYAQAIVAFAKDEEIEALELSEISDKENGVYAKLKGSEVAFIRAEKSQLSGKLLEVLEDALKQGHGASLLLKDSNQWLYSRSSMMTLEMELMTL